MKRVQLDALVNRIKQAKCDWKAASTHKMAENFSQVATDKYKV